MWQLVEYTLKGHKVPLFNPQHCINWVWGCMPAIRSKVQSHPSLQSKLRGSLGHISSCVKKEIHSKKKKKKVGSGQEDGPVGKTICPASMRTWIKSPASVWKKTGTDLYACTVALEGRDIWFLGAHWLASLAKWSFQFDGRSCLKRGRLTMCSSHFHTCMQGLQHTQMYAPHTKLNTVHCKVCHQVFYTNFFSLLFLSQ